VTLGALIHIDYGMERPSFYSNTRMEFDLAAPRAALGQRKLDIHPEEITATENAAFVWEIA